MSIFIGVKAEDIQVGQRMLLPPDDIRQAQVVVTVFSKSVGVQLRTLPSGMREVADCVTLYHDRGTKVAWPGDLLQVETQ
jgi:hypothetical protein